MKAVVLGAGRMGRRHIQVVREIGLELVGICDSSQESLLLAQNEQAVPPGLHFTDAQALISEKGPECVVIATTAPSHLEYTELAARLGAKYILCEKPMATSVHDCDRMIEVCRDHGAQLAINHQMRFMEQYTEPKRLMNSEAFGGLASVTVLAGNFGMAMNGTHYFEMFRYMTDEDPLEVTAWFSSEKVPNPRGEQYEDRAGSVRITTSKGHRFYMEAGSDQGNGVNVIHAGRNGQIVVDELAGMMSLTVREEEHRGLPTTRYGMPSHRTQQAIRPVDVISPSLSVLQSLLKGENPPTGEHGRLAVAVLVAAYVSHEEGHRPVSIEEVKNYRDRVFPWA
jgi:predicted dehydrogenase